MKTTSKISKNGTIRLVNQSSSRSPGIDHPAHSDSAKRLGQTPTHTPCAQSQRSFASMLESFVMTFLSPPRLGSTRKWEALHSAAQLSYTHIVKSWSVGWLAGESSAPHYYSLCVVPSCVASVFPSNERKRRRRRR